MARLMWLPGFYPLKEKPVHSEIFKENRDIPLHTCDEIYAWFPSVKEAVQRSNEGYLKMGQLKNVH